MSALQMFDRDSLILTCTRILDLQPDLRRNYCYEVRALRCRDRPGSPWRYTAAGYFDDGNCLLQCAVPLSGRADGVCIVPNPLDRALICRAKNRMERRPQHTTRDEDVLCRRWLLVDADPVRPPGISSTDAEHKAGLERARLVRDCLQARSFQGLILADSGNGGHVLVPLPDAPNTEEAAEYFRQVLQDLHRRFSDDRVEIDRATFNAARLTKLYGTLACKGDHCPEEGRPWRLSRILEVAD